MSRTRPALVLVLALALLSPAVAHADVRHAVKFRWVGPLPAAARAGEAVSGRLEVLTKRPAILDELRVEGDGWTQATSTASKRARLDAAVPYAFDFRAVPSDVSRPLMVRGTVDGVPFEKALRFDAASLAKEGRPGAARFVDGRPRLGGGAVRERGSGRPGTSAQSIRFHGRFVYSRAGDGLTLGADHIVVRVMDDDPLGDEQIWSGETTETGYFDVTVDWDDCDITGCDDPDIYVRFEPVSSVTDVQHDNLTETSYAWTTEDATIADFMGSDVDFGTLTPVHAAEYGAVQIYNDLVRAHRYAGDHGLMYAPEVDCQWPNGDGTYYDPDFSEIHIDPTETWVEATHVHEYGHFLHDTFGNLLGIDYENGFCDSPTPGHCVWCPEAGSIGWQEGWADWYGSVVTRNYPARYGITPGSIGDLRYVLESVLPCGIVPGDFYPGSQTEGYVGAVLRDIEDEQNEDADGGDPDCDMDVLALGPEPILQVFRDDDPTSIEGFIASFRARLPQYDMDLWSTTRNVDVLMGIPLPPLAMVQQPVDCVRARRYGPLHLSALGNGSLLQYQWRRNGAALNNGGVRSGVRTPNLVIEFADTSDAGTYDCVVSSCDGSDSLVSTASIVSVPLAAIPSPLISWGENVYGEVGDGTLSSPHLPYTQPSFTDVAAACGGQTFTLTLRSDGTVWAWGQQNTGELGNGAGASTETLPIQITDLADVVQIAASDFNGYALLADGTVMAWGYNGNGCVGDGTRITRNRPVAASLPGCVRAIAAGEVTALALLDDGTIWAWGQNEHGMLGNGVIGGLSNPVPAPVVGMDHAIAIASRGLHSYAIRDDHHAWAWGAGTNGQLGSGLLADSPVPVAIPGLTLLWISAGARNGYAMDVSQHFYSWGSGSDGLLANGATSGVQATPVHVPALDGVRKIESGNGLFGVALTTSAELKVWGRNASGSFGQPTPLLASSPITVPGISYVSGFGVGWSTVHAFGILAGIVSAPAPEAPRTLSMRAGPSPFISRLAIGLDLPRATTFSVGVFDVSGRRVNVVAEGSRAAGRYAFDWNGRDHIGSRAPAGVYFIRARVGAEELSRRVVFTR